MMEGLGRKFAELRIGSEPLLDPGSGPSVTVLDFWRWSTSDLLSNATRGVFAEFIVALATGCDIRKPREEWSAHDLTTPEGIRIEVRSAAYLQAWNQPKGLSTISFGIKETRKWDSETNQQALEKSRVADVYVFCLLHHTDKTTVDPLDLRQWTFFVMSIRELDAYTRSRHSITLKSLEPVSMKTDFARLGDAVRLAHSR